MLTFRAWDAETGEGGASMEEMVVQAAKGIQAEELGSDRWGRPERRGAGGSGD